MYCPNCRATLPEGTQFCPGCGTRIASQQQAPLYQAQPYAQPGYVTPELPMNWYKFLIYFGLFASGVLNVINGILMLTGGHYNGAAEFVYSVFDGLQVLDILVGLMSIGCGAFAIYTRFRLSGFCKNGPAMLTYVYIAGAVVSVVYLFGLMLIMEEAFELVDISSYIGSLAISVAMIFANKAYFDKRKHLFDNF